MFLKKSSYQNGLNCQKSVWYDYHHTELANEESLDEIARAKEGYAVEELAKGLFKNPVSIEIRNPELAEKETISLVKQNTPVIHQATAITNNRQLQARVDFLVSNFDYSFDFFEVKSSTNGKSKADLQKLIEDLAFQYYVFTNANYKITKCNLVYINSKYLFTGDLILNEFFEIKDVTEEVLACQETITKNLPKILATINTNTEPNTLIGSQCKGCKYTKHCLKEVPEYSILNIFNNKPAWDIFQQIKSFEIKDLPKDFYPKGNKLIDIKSYLTNKPHLNFKAIDSFLEKLKYPLYFLDYETISTAIPRFKFSTPYQQIPFQFSLHVMDKPNAEIKHYEFLHKEPSDPRESLVKYLCEIITENSSVIVYNQSFEKNVNQKLADLFPEFRERLNRINDNLVDLMTPFQQRSIYHPAQKSSYSIKKVLPAFTDLSYSELNITNGGKASSDYLKFSRGEYQGDKETLFKDLLDYCELDTKAMVILLRNLSKLREAT